MRRVYLVVPGARLSHSLVQELLSDGISEHDIRLIARQPGTLRDLPVPVTRFRPGPDILLKRSMAGAVLALIGGLVVIALTGLGTGAVGILISVTLVGAVVGAATAIGSEFPAELRPLRREVGPDDAVMLLDVPDDRLGELEQTIASRHPEIRVKGTDARGTPPTP